jgi:hypothetical protein
MFRFSIRELMLVTLVVALGLSWFAEHRQLQGALKESQDNLWRRERVEGHIEQIEMQLKRQGFEIAWVCFGNCPKVQKQSAIESAGSR